MLKVSKLISFSFIKSLSAFFVSWGSLKFFLNLVKKRYLKKQYKPRICLLRKKKIGIIFYIYYKKTKCTNYQLICFKIQIPYQIIYLTFYIRNFFFKNNNNYTHYLKNGYQKIGCIDDKYITDIISDLNVQAKNIDAPNFKLKKSRNTIISIKKNH